MNETRCFTSRDKIPIRLCPAHFGCIGARYSAEGLELRDEHVLEHFGVAEREGGEEPAGNLEQR